MAKYKVKKVFQDIHTKEKYKVDQEIEVPVKRAKEIITNLDESFIERADEPKEELKKSR